jgi:farnesyl-diphosphate farnesyltransferase
MNDTSSDLLTSLLKAVSRSFYLTLRVLPSPIRSQIGLAYLLARTTDTIADTELVPIERRVKALMLLRDRILGMTSQPMEFTKFAEKQSSGAEKRLLFRCEESVGLLSSFSQGDQQQIREVLRIIVSGQELDLKRFSSASPENIACLENEAELDDYTYRVAGCVGEFWTRMCRTHIFPKVNIDERLLLSRGVRFGKGLQLVNILRDLPRDLRTGRCYFPADELKAAGLTVSDLLQPETEPRFRFIYDRYLEQAYSHLAAGWEYTVSLPKNQRRLRLACAWPILIGVETIKKLRLQNPLDYTRRIKVTRGDIRSILCRSLVLLPDQSRWESLGPRS